MSAVSFPEVGRGRRRTKKWLSKRIGLVDCDSIWPPLESSPQVTPANEREKESSYFLPALSLGRFIIISATCFGGVFPQFSTLRTRATEGASLNGSGKDVHFFLSLSSIGLVDSLCRLLPYGTAYVTHWPGILVCLRWKKNTFQQRAITHVSLPSRISREHGKRWRW